MNVLKTQITGSVAAGILGLALLSAAPVEASARTLGNGIQNAPAAATQIDYRWGGGWHRGPAWRYDRLGPRQIRRSLRHQGFRKIQIVRERGRVYVVKARGWRGRPVRLVVDAYNAQILRRHPIGWGQRWQ
ncbi:hypothetical protein JM93_03613 [Roseibium hamelinense]|uniref:YpeB-like protein with protease inhibitory function n=1 Tax=Roseibium hamelinense TaxID=150831 RepID=A0A562SMA4_9HYPH|nr:hypothetical protein JM93_03613 [Roseibium hamelinense]